VSLRYDGGTATVFRTADGAWLGAGDEGATLLDTRPAGVGIAGGRKVVGGLLPPGATQAEVEGTRATTGNGAWVAVIDDIGLDQRIAARYAAADGTIVRPALPAAWARAPVTDADEPCPACGALTWERVTPADDSRGTKGPPGGPTQPASVIVCSRCGHEVDEGSWFAVGPGDGTPPSPPPRPRPPAPPLEALDFPVYALAGGRPEPSGRGWDREGVHSVSLRHDAVEVTTRARRHAFIPHDHELAFALRPVIEEAAPLDWGHGSPAARALRMQAHGRAIAARVARAEPFTVQLPVDGEPVPFAGLRDPAGWAAVADTPRARIVVAARVATDAVALRRIEHGVGSG
jgi:hypothetical protein